MDWTLVIKACQEFSAIPKTEISAFWYLIQHTFPLAPWIVISGFLLWILFEIKTRNGNWHYNSANGYSPPFNRVIGGGSYIFFQTLFYFLLTFIFGDGVYCYGWPLIMHYIVYLLTRESLIKTGFWVYRKKLKVGRRSRRQKY